MKCGECGARFGHGPALAMHLGMHARSAAREAEGVAWPSGANRKPREKGGGIGAAEEKEEVTPKDLLSPAPHRIVNPEP